MIHRLALATLVLISTLGAACGKKEPAAPAPSAAAPSAPPEPKPADPAAAPAPPPPADEFKNGACEVKIEGDDSATAKAPGGVSAVGSDYWMTDADLEQALKMLAGSGPDAEQKLKEALAKDPKIYTLILNCSAGRVSLNFAPTAGSKYADVPFGPKKYALVPPPGKPGEMTMLFSLDQKTFYRPASPGTLDLTKFDVTGIAGTFSFEGEEQFPEEGKPRKKVKVTGTVDYKCAGFSKCAP